MAGSLEGVLAKIPGYGGYLAKKQYNEQQDMQELQQASSAMGLLASLQQQQDSAKLKALLADSGGDPEVAAQTALKAGNIKAARDLEPLVKAQQERKQREDTPRMLADISRLGAPQPATAQVAPDFPTAAPNDAMAAVPTGAEPANPMSDRQARATKLTAMSLLPAYANNPVVQQRLQAEIDKLNVKPMVEHNFSIGENQVQPHISFDEGRTWAPIPGSKPSAKFAGSEKLVSIVGPDGKPTLVPASQAVGKRPASATELPPLEGPALVSAGSQVASGMPVSQVVPGYGRNIGDRRESARKEAISQIKAQNPGMTDEAAGQELANRTIDFTAGKKSVGQLTTMLGATRQAVDQLDFNVRKVTEQMDKLPSSDLSPIINAIARGEQKWTGDPAYSALFYYMHAAGMESARILQGGQASVAQLHQGAADAAKQWADANFTTPKAWKEGVAPAMTAEGQERLRTYERAIAKQRMGGAGGTPAPAAAPSNGGWSITPVK